MLARSCQCWSINRKVGCVQCLLKKEMLQVISRKNKSKKEKAKRLVELLGEIEDR